MNLKSKVPCIPLEGSISYENWLKGRRARRESSQLVAPGILRRQTSSSDQRLKKLFNGKRGLPFHADGKIMTGNLPTREEINVYDSLDERSACGNFLGKTLAEAEVLFRENSLYYQEDLMWMGPVAFRFYVSAAIQYIQSPEAVSDEDMINCFAGVLEFRLEHERQELLPIAKQLAEACRYIIENFKRFSNADPELYIHLDFRPRYEKLIAQLLALKNESHALGKHRGVLKGQGLRSDDLIEAMRGRIK